jgi:hypothetical protein
MQMEATAFLVCAKRYPLKRVTRDAGGKLCTKWGSLLPPERMDIGVAGIGVEEAVYVREHRYG